MNITIVVSHFRSVSESFITSQITSLIDKGHDIAIYSYHKEDFDKAPNVIKQNNLLKHTTFKQHMPKNSIKRIYLFFSWVFSNFFKLDWLLLFKSLNFIKYKKRALNLSLFFNSQHFLLRDKPDIIHVHFGNNAVPIAELKALGFIKKSKLIVSFHGYDLDPSKISFYKKYYKIVFKEATSFTVNTIFLKKILIRVNSKLKNIHVLPVGLDTTLFRKSKKTKPSKVFKIVYCGRLIPLKGADIAIDILIEIVNRGYKNTQLTIIGEGNFRKELERIIKNENIHNHVSLVGAKSQNFIIDEMDNSNLFILPGTKDPITGRVEAQGLVIQEAQSMELPVVVSDVGGMKYGLLPNETGFVVKEKNVKAFADVIEKLINSSKLSKNMGAKGRDFVVKNYDSKVLVDKLIKIYNS